MADQSDVRRIALSLPETTAAGDKFAFSVLNKGKQKGFVWAWNERVEPKKPRVPRDDVVAVRVVDQADKEALLAGAALIRPWRGRQAAPNRAPRRAAEGRGALRPPI